MARGHRERDAGGQAPRLLVSACLMGDPVRYDGSARALRASCLARWMAEGRLLKLCPELIAGFEAPRLAAEIADGRNGADVLAGRGVILDSKGNDLTAAYLAGARAAAAAALQFGCSIALLTDGSPSCGSLAIHDGSFSGARHPGNGVFSALLTGAGIAVYPDRALATVAELMDR